MTKILSALVFAALALMTGATPAEELRDIARTLLGSVKAATPKEINDPKAILGQALFWDMRLSSTGALACGTCHNPQNWGSDSRPSSVTARGVRTRQSQTVFHSQDTVGLHWLADLASGADHARGAITKGMGFDKREDILAVMAGLGYAKLFKAAFPGEKEPITVDNYAHALETYQRTLRTRAPFDAWLDGDDRAMTKKQVSGLQRFISLGCVNCHVGPLAGGTMRQRFGLVENYALHTGSASLDDGLMRITGNEKDRHIFRVPLLRNIAKTPPYFHDGSVPDLKKATDIMAKVQLGQTLNDDALNELVAFMEALTGPIPKNFHTPKGIPFALPKDMFAK